MAYPQPRHSEPSANNELGDLLRAMLSRCRVRSENTQLIEGRPGLQLDNLITAADRAPVVVEAKYEAVGTAEEDAAARLGLRVVDEIHPIEAAIALRYPDTVRFADNLRDALSAARLSYAVLYQDGSRFPESGWLEGGVADLADLIRLESGVGAPAGGGSRRQRAATGYRPGVGHTGRPGHPPAPHYRYRRRPAGDG